MTLGMREAYVIDRFDELESRFKTEVSSSDYRFEAIRRALDPLSGRRILDLGCGKGRFARQLALTGADVVGLDASGAMLRSAKSLARVRATALRLPLASKSFDAVVAVEVFQHLQDSDRALREIHRILKPGGFLAIVDRNAAALNVARPWLPNLAVKRVDEWRGRWMYPRGAPVREQWFWPEAFRRRLARHFEMASLAFLLAPDEAGRAVFRQFPGTRSLALWTAQMPGACHE